MKKTITLIALSLALQVSAQIKAIRINTLVNLKSGLTIPSGSIVVISEGYAKISSVKNDSIPCQVSSLVYVSNADYISGKDPIQNISIKDFNPVFMGLNMPVSGYISTNTQDLLISVIFSYLNEIYPNKIEVIQL